MIEDNKLLQSIKNKVEYIGASRCRICNVKCNFSKCSINPKYEFKDIANCSIFYRL